jgi:hypothetical protein
MRFRKKTDAEKMEDPRILERLCLAADNEKQKVLAL